MGDQFREHGVQAPIDTKTTLVGTVVFFGQRGGDTKSFRMFISTAAGIAYLAQYPEDFNGKQAIDGAGALLDAVQDFSTLRKLVLGVKIMRDVGASSISAAVGN